MEQFRAHAMVPETVLHPGEIGPLEILYFLLYELSETAGTTYGRIVIDIALLCAIISM